MRIMFALTLVCGALWLVAGYWIGTAIFKPAACTRIVTEEVADFGEWREIHDL